MSATEILEALAKLPPAEQLFVEGQLRLMIRTPISAETSGGSPAEKFHTVADFIRAWQEFPPDESLAASLEEVDRADQPIKDPWAS